MRQEVLIWLVVVMIVVMMLVMVSVYAGRPGDLKRPKENLFEELGGESRMKAKEILKHLDEHMGDELTLVNPNRQLADTRMTVFRSNKNWVIFFELVGTIKEIFEGVEIYAYGNCIGQQGFIETRSLFSVPEDAPLFDEEGIWIGDRSHFSVIIKGKRYDFKPTKEDYLAAGITFPDDRTGPNSLRPIDLIRFLCHHLNHPFFVSEDYLRYLLDKLAVEAIKKRDWCSLGQEMSLFFQTREWQHPDLALEEKPSQMEYFQVLARAIERGDPSELKKLDPSTFNTDWRKVEVELKKDEEETKGVILWW
ncbi:hypothetical protein B0813_002311 [Candidatus Fervidibacteria bacterium JGI MDM2 SSWTFF-3-K9]